MVFDLPDYSKKVIVVYEGTITGGEVQVDHRKIKGLTLKDPYVALCIPSSIENPALAYDAINDRFKVTVEDWDIASIVADISDKWARQLGLVDISRVLGAAMSHSNPLYMRLTNGSTFIDPRDRNWTITEALARSWLLTASDIVTVNAGTNLNTSALALEATLGTVHGHVDSIDGKITACNTGAVVISSALPAGSNAIGKLAANSGVDIGDVDILSLPTVTVQQTTRASMTVKPEREDLVSLGGVASPNAAGVQIVAANGQKKIKVYDCGYEALAAGLHYFYFGTSTAATTQRFLTRQTIGAILKTVVQPRVSAAGDGLYLYSAVSETNMPYDVGYIQE